MENFTDLKIYIFKYKTCGRGNAMEFSVNYRKAKMLGTVLFCFLIPVFQGVKTTKNYTWSGSSLISIFVFLDVGAGNGFRGGGTAPYSHWGRIRDLTF